MSASTDKTKGKIKQATGDLTDDNKLRREGKIEELAGKTKDVIDKVVGKLTRNR